MLTIANLLIRLESARMDLDLALEYESKLRLQSNKALDDALQATQSASQAALDVLNCKNENEMVFLKMKKNEKNHYARLFAAIARDAAELANQAQHDNAIIFIEVKKIAHMIASLLIDEQINSENQSLKAIGD
jgi:hypothetical protein